MSNVDRVLEGAIDIHVHIAPDPLVERRADTIDVARQAQEMGMQGLVLKSHQYPTHPVAHTVSQVIPQLRLIGGIALDVEVGGLNPMTVEATAQHGRAGGLDAHLLCQGRPGDQGPQRRHLSVGRQRAVGPGSFRGT